MPSLATGARSEATRKGADEFGAGRFLAFDERYPHHQFACGRSPNEAVDGSDNRREQRLTTGLSERHFENFGWQGKPRLGIAQR